MLKRAVRLLKLHLRNICNRDDVSLRHLKGSGLEIGAMHFPLAVGPGVCVKYVDVNTRLENIALYPEIDCTKVVETDFVEDGFTLVSFEDGCVDFVIANHVLEHSCDPFGTLQNWSRILKPNGILFVSVPNYLKCFDRGRTLTSLEHVVQDYLDAKADPESLRRRNRDHYREWIDISLPNASHSNNLLRLPKAEEEDEWIEKMLQTGKVHFHTFDRSAYMKMLTHYVCEIDCSLKLVRIYNSSKQFEFIAILQKLPMA